MKATLLVGTLAVTTTLCAQTTNTTTSGSPTAVVSANPAAVPANPASSRAVLSAELTRSLDARKAKPGDAVFAKCTQNLDANGETLIPRNTKLIGHVVEVQTKGRGKPESTLEIAFDKAIMRDGREVPLTASIQALAPPAIMATEVGNTDFGVRSAPSAKPRTAGLLPGTVKTVAPDAAHAVDAPALAANTTGAVALKGLQLEPDSSSIPKTSVIHSSSQNVRLESGTRLILRVALP